MTVPLCSFWETSAALWLSSVLCCISKESGLQASRQRGCQGNKSGTELSVFWDKERSLYWLLEEGPHPAFHCHCCHCCHHCQWESFSGLLYPQTHARFAGSSFLKDRDSPWKWLNWLFLEWIEAKLTWWEVGHKDIQVLPFTLGVWETDLKMHLELEYSWHRAICSPLQNLVEWGDDLQKDTMTGHLWWVLTFPLFPSVLLLDKSKCSCITPT